MDNNLFARPHSASATRLSAFRNNKIQPSESLNSSIDENANKNRRISNAEEIARRHIQRLAFKSLTQAIAAKKRRRKPKIIVSYDGDGTENELTLKKVFKNFIQFFDFLGVFKKKKPRRRNNEKCLVRQSNVVIIEPH